VTATFSLDYLNRFEMKFNAVTNKATIVNLCNHAYWNLAGHNSPAPSSLLSHQLEINASQFTPNDDSMIPFGHLASVAGTPFDFRSSTAIGAHIAELYNDRKSGGGYDLNFCIDRSSASDATELVRFCHCIFFFFSPLFPFLTGVGCASS
jgi:aldose 1-epimerase